MAHGSYSRLKKAERSLLTDLEANGSHNQSMTCQTPKSGGVTTRGVSWMTGADEMLAEYVLAGTLVFVGDRHIPCPCTGDFQQSLWRCGE